MHRFNGWKSLDTSSRGRTSRAHVAWLAPAALASTLLVGAAAVASNFNTYTSQTAFNSFVTGPTFTQTFTGNNTSAAFYDFSGNSFAYRVAAVTSGSVQVNVSLVNNPLSAITPSSISAGNSLVFTRQAPSSVISAFGGFFSMSDGGNGGTRTSGTMTLTAFNGASQVFQGSFAVGDTGGTFFGIAGQENSPITSVRLSGVADPTFNSVNAEQLTLGVVPVPEPSTLALGGCALVAIVLARRLKPRKARAVIGTAVAILAMHVTSSMADSSFTPQPSTTAVVLEAGGRYMAPPMEPLGPSSASSL